jgi:hypothetical protein
MKENIRERTYNHNHAGKASERRGLDRIRYELSMWKNERIASHEQGHKESELCFPGEIGGHGLEENPQDQEIVLFDYTKEPMDTGEFDSDGNKF